MRHILLIGAGFSRNWGGWLSNEAFEYLIGCPEINSNRTLLDLLWQHRSDGFESAIAEVQRKWVIDPHANLNNLRDLQAAVGQMFSDMNGGLAKVDFEFQNYSARMVKSFLARFDAIFTLNQDLLLEQHYCPVMETTHYRRWLGCEFPGMRRQRASGNPGDDWASSRWYPDDTVTGSAAQPIYKLHGSSNWIAVHGEPLMIIGGNKIANISHHKVLSGYFEAFEYNLSQPETRLMIIGYGFRDGHINEVLIRELEHQLKVFVISPDGADTARRVSPISRNAGAGSERSNLELAFVNGVIGASRRSLRETFGSDSVEFQKVMRFFD